MSYARWGSDSDVYVIVAGGDDGDVLQCIGCGINGQSYNFKSAKELIKHLKEHKKHGVKVPEHLLKKETFNGWNK